jgi:hypothetical protein
VHIEPARWSYVYTEAFYKAFSTILSLKGNVIDLLNNAGSEYTSSTKLHFQIRVKASNFKSKLLLHDNVEKMVTLVRDKSFNKLLIETLDAQDDSAASTSPGSDSNSNSNRRFGWLFAQDVEVLSAVALPIGDEREPLHIDTSNTAASNATWRDLILTGAALGAVVALVTLLYMHYRLRQEYLLLSKDKSSIGKSTATLRKLWDKFAEMTAKANRNNANLSLEEMKREVELSRTGLMQSYDEEEEEAGFQH